MTCYKPRRSSSALLHITCGDLGSRRFGRTMINLGRGIEDRKRLWEVDRRVFRRFPSNKKESKKEKKHGHWLVLGQKIRNINP